MVFLRQLFQRKKPKHQEMRGTAPVQSDEDREATRTKMEAELTADRERRAAKASEAGPEEDAPKSD
jgi:hypothetical protein